jgi:hypothetical protein
MSRIKSRDVKLKTDLFEKKKSPSYISTEEGKKTIEGENERETHSSSVDRMYWTSLHIPEEGKKRKKKKG